MLLSERFNWDRLRVFRLVAEAGSMTSAAKTLGESTPTISRRVNDLERELNTKLFRRSKRGVDLTSAGKRLFDLTHNIQSVIDSVSSEVAELGDPVSGAIKIKASDGLGPHWIASHLPAFLLSNPGLQVDLDIGLATTDVLDRQADLAIVFEKPKHPEIIATRLGTLHYIFFASQGYIDAHGKPATLFDFTNHQLIMHTDYVHQVERWAASVRELKDLIDYSVITNSGTALMTICVQGGGIAVLPSYAATIDPRLKPLDLPAVAPIEFWLTYTERVRRSAVGKAAIEWLQSLFDHQKYPWFDDVFLHPRHVPDYIELSSGHPPR